MLENASRPTNPLRQLQALGQSIWLDDIRRGSLTGGEFQSFVHDDGVSGVTSNPAIFEAAIARSDEYTEAIARLAGAGLQPQAIYETLAIEDIRLAADILRGVYDTSGARDGYVSLEVSPHLAHDTEGTVREARRLWALIARPNVMIKIPGTAAGVHAVTQALAEGINVNVTLLFSVSRYRDIVLAFIAGIEQRAAAGLPVDRVVSVASFFLSRIDTLIDKQLDAIGTDAARVLRGQAAIASARLAYQEYQTLMRLSRWQKLHALGAQPQRLLWASTSTKNPAYPDTRYVDALIGPETVNTLPLDTLHAYRDHGQPLARLQHELAQAYALPQALRMIGIDLDRIAAELERDGVKKFIGPFDRLLDTLAKRAHELTA